MLILITCLEVFVVSGCEGIHLWQYPARDPQVQWVSENPNMYFAWDEENGGQRGKLIVGENIWLVEVGFRPNCISVLCLSSDNENLIGKVLFDGDCKYGESEITVSVTNDDANIFEGDLPTIVFEKKEKNEGETSVK